jgi:hypothetical protein
VPPARLKFAAGRPRSTTACVGRPAHAAGTAVRTPAHESRAGSVPERARWLPAVRWQHPWQHPDRPVRPHRPRAGTIRTIWHALGGYDTRVTRLRAWSGITGWRRFESSSAHKSEGPAPRGFCRSWAHRLRQRCGSRHQHGAGERRSGAPPAPIRAVMDSRPPPSPVTTIEPPRPVTSAARSWLFCAPTKSRATATLRPPWRRGCHRRRLLQS